MAVLDVQEINNHFLDNRYLLNVLHQPDLWNSLNIPQLPPATKVKFDENIKINIPQAIRNSKGLYMFFIEPLHPFEPIINHLLYVGRVREGQTNFNFFKRFDDYKNQIGNINGSLNKILLTNLWPDFTHVYFYSLNNFTDDEIARIEDEIIKKIVPPLNSKIGGKTEQSRNLY